MIALGIHSTLEEVLEKLGMKDYEEKFKSEQIDVSSLVRNLLLDCGNQCGHYDIL